MKFEIKDEFYLNDEPLKIISGSIHYFRSPSESWDDLLYKLKKLGCNTVETYVPWNLHQPQETEFDFSENLDIVKFLKKAQEHELLAIVRIGPYMCAEADFGGLPWWLIPKGLRIRTNDDMYLSYVEKYFKQLISYLQPAFIENGGNVILGQLENEFGSFSNDKEYLYKLHSIIKDCGFKAPLVTSDGAWGNMLENGTMYNELGILPTVNFGSDARVHFNTLQKFVGQTKVPYMCMEFWCGWFTSWGHEKINKSDPVQVAKELDEILKRGSVNFYMFHGGTNFANISGANKTLDTGYYAHITSYDYDALLDERGNITEKYKLCREIISKYKSLDALDVGFKPSKNYGSVKYIGSKPMFDNSNPVQFKSTPLSIEQLGYGYGYINYKLSLPTVRSLSSLDIRKLTDRAYLRINGELIKVLEGSIDYHIELNMSFDQDPVLELLFECNPRTNYGQFLEEGAKGLLGGIFVNNHFFATGYEHQILDITNEEVLKGDYKQQSCTEPHISKYEIYVDECIDTYLDSSKLGKGYAFVNGKNIGRFWNVGPQYKLYIPKSYLKVGLNQIYIIDTELLPTSFELIE